MSNSITVFLNKKNMPTAKEWANAIEKEGFGLKIDTSYEEEENNDGFYGFRPCKYYDLEDVGYELDILLREENLDDFSEWDEMFSEIKQYDSAVVFGVYSEYDSYASMVAGCVLAKISGGIYFDLDEPVDLNELCLQCKDIDHKLKTNIG